MPEAFISITTSWASGVGSRNCISSNPRSPVNTTPRMVSSRFVLVGGGEFDRKMRGWQRDSKDRHCCAKRRRNHKYAVVPANAGTHNHRPVLLLEPRGFGGRGGEMAGYASALALSRYGGWRPTLPFWGRLRKKMTANADTPAGRGRQR